MELKLENDFLALVNADRYQELKDKATANENTPTSALETGIQIVFGAMAVGAIGYMGYTMHESIKDNSQRRELYTERDDLRKQLDQLKKDLGHE